MNNYFIWFVIDGDIDPSLKGKYSASVHSYIFGNNGIKLKTKSNAFFMKSNLDENQISDKITSLSNKQVKLFVVKLDNSSYQGWLSEKQWDFIS